MSIRAALFRQTCVDKLSKSKVYSWLTPGNHVVVHVALTGIR